MFKKHRLKFLFSVLLLVSLFLSACSNSTSNAGKSNNNSGKKSSSSSSSSSKPQTTKQFKSSLSKFPQQTSNSKPAIKDGVLTYGLVSDTPFEGTLNEAFYTGQPDYDVMQFFDEPLLYTDANYNIDNKGPATFTMSKDNKSITIKIKKNLNWSDGKPVTAQDLQFAYEVIGSSKYTGVRYDNIFQNVVGMGAYHSGKAKSISGIKIIDSKTIQINFIKADPSILSGLWTYPLPKHYLGNVPIDKMAQSDKIRKTPIGFGPYKIKSMVPGESVVFVPNTDYWKGTPKLKQVILKVVNPNTVVASLKKGSIDIASLPTDQYTAAKDAKNFQLIGNVDLAYSYIGFKLGHWDKTKKENVMDPNMKMSNINLRQAMAYAVDNSAVATKLYNNLRFSANTLIPPSFPNYHDDSVKGYPFDPAKAKQLLDAAGYKDVNGDGFREDPNGKKLVINFLSMSGGSVAEPLANYYIQAWKNVGLDVQLVDGRLHEFNSFYKMVETDDPKIDIYAGAWGTGTNVDPSGLYSRTSQFNYSRFTSTKNDLLLKEGESPKAFDINYRKDVYNQWQQYMSDQLPVMPTLFRSALYAVNNRVKNFSIAPGTDLGWGDVAVTN